MLGVVCAGISDWSGGNRNSLRDAEGEQPYFPNLHDYLYLAYPQVCFVLRQVHFRKVIHNRNLHRNALQNLVPRLEN